MQIFQFQNAGNFKLYVAGEYEKNFEDDYLFSSIHFRNLEN